MWEKLKYFKYDSKVDNWGDPDKMNWALLTKLDAFREYIGSPVIVTSGTGGKHIANSQHYKGNAVDIVVPYYSPNLIELYLASERFNFNGIGVYPDWEYNGEETGGLHLDMRPFKECGRWVGYKNAKRETVYFALTYKKLRKEIRVKK